MKKLISLLFVTMLAGSVFAGTYYIEEKAKYDGRRDVVCYTATKQFNSYISNIQFIAYTEVYNPNGIGDGESSPGVRCTQATLHVGYNGFNSAAGGIGSGWFSDDQGTFYHQKEPFYGWDRPNGAINYFENYIELIANTPGDEVTGGIVYRY